MAETTGEQDEARIHLRVDRRERQVSVPVPLGPRTFLDLLPAARAVAQGLSTLAAEAALDEGRAIACRRGCTACCRQYLSISVVEAEALARVVAGLPAPRRDTVQQRFGATLLRLEQAGLLDPHAPRGGRRITVSPHERTAATAAATARRYLDLAIPCPLLEEGGCVLYPVRPLMCLEYCVSSPPERCARPYGGGVEKVTPPLHIGLPLAQAAAKLLGLEHGHVPLALALEWSRAHGQRLATLFDGAVLFRTFIAAIDRAWSKPFEERQDIDSGERSG